MPVESAIYWNSIDSQRSASGGSCGDIGSSRSGSRHYVDPWDLENYAYLRRHSIAIPTHPSRPGRSICSRSPSRNPRARSECWCAPTFREPGYDAPAFVEELYCATPVRTTNNACYYHQPIYEDEISDYVTQFPIYAPLSDRVHYYFENDATPEHECRSTSCRRSRVREKYLHHSVRNNHHKGTDVPLYDLQQDYHPSSVTPEEERYMVEVIPPPHIDLNTYGHLKIDYTKSWNSLNRKISK